MIEKYQEHSRTAYKAFLQGNPQANYCHDPAWLEVFRESYGKEGFILLSRNPDDGSLQGAAPACAVNSLLFGRNLVCLPYLDYGGILAANDGVRERLMRALLSEAAARGANLEIRCRDPLEGLATQPNVKVAMTLSLTDPGAPPAVTPPAGTGPAGNWEPYWKSLDAKVRNQVRKAEKSEVSVVWGREERLDDFYRVFCVNMRDLGSPTHSKGFFASVLRHMPGAGIGTAHRQGRCIGGLFRILWGDSLAIPWASTLKEERVHCPNNALYWESIRHAFEKGCASVDFGRSSREEGTYRFKKQWLAAESPLHWYQFDARGNAREQVAHAASGKMGIMKNLWARLPLPIANVAGPLLRGGISA